MKKLIKHNYNLIIKIDVEGHELVVLEQIVKSNLIIKVDYIFIEINFKRNNLIKIRRILKKFKFIEIYKSKIINNHSDFLFEKRN